MYQLFEQLFDCWKTFVSHWVASGINDDDENNNNNNNNNNYNMPYHKTDLNNNNNSFKSFQWLFSGLDGALEFNCIVANATVIVNELWIRL